MGTIILPKIFHWKLEILRYHESSKIHKRTRQRVPSTNNGPLMKKPGETERERERLPFHRKWKKDEKKKKRPKRKREKKIGVRTASPESSGSKWLYIASAANAMASKLEAAWGQIECMPASSVPLIASDVRFGGMDEPRDNAFCHRLYESLDTRHDVGYERRETRVSISARYAAPLWNAHLLTFVAACLAKPRTRSFPGKHASWTRFRRPGSRWESWRNVRGWCSSAEHRRWNSYVIFQNLSFKDNCFSYVSIFDVRI